MVNSSSRLPDPFVDLEKYVAEWALPTEGERKTKRARSSMEELNDFYEAVSPRIREMTSFLSEFPMTELSELERNVFHLSCMYMEVAVAVEYYKQPEIPGGFPLERFEIHTV